MRSVVKPYAGFLLGSVTVLCAAIWAVEQSSLLILVCSVLILLAGLPHGAYDWVIMRAHYGKEQLVSAVAAYVALVLLVIALSSKLGSSDRWSTRFIGWCRCSGAI